ncbi:MAG TPA: hypothetical protein VMI72_18505, partial [Roseiarcus sp.]|nr:hypothetical protein [Roseiarcus sp.]
RTLDVGGDARGLRGARRRWLSSEPQNGKGPRLGTAISQQRRPSVRAAFCFVCFWRQNTFLFSEIDVIIRFFKKREHAPNEPAH